MARAGQSDQRQDTHNVAQTIAQDALENVQGGTKSVRDFGTKFYHDWSHHTTQALAFVLVTSIVPLAMLIIAIMGKIIGTLDTNAQTRFIQQLQNVFPDRLPSQEIVQSAFQRLSESAGIWIFVSVLAAIFFGSRLFTLLEACFDIIYRVPIRSFKSKNIRAVILVLIFMVLTPILVFASLLPGQIVALIQQTPFDSQASIISKIIGIFTSLLISFVLFETIYTFIPNRQGTLQQRARASITGSIVASLALQLALILFSTVAALSTQGVVGQIALVLVTLVFFYLIALVTLLGATVNAYFVENVQPTTSDLVTRLSKTAR